MILPPRESRSLPASNSPVALKATGLFLRGTVPVEGGHRLVVRNGFLPQRKIMTGIGAVEVQQPRVRDRRPVHEQEKFTLSILPPYLRKTKSVEELLPWLCLKGISTGDFGEALQALLGENAKGLSPTTIAGRCCRSTAFPLGIGLTCARRIRSSRRSRPFACGRTRGRAANHALRA